MRLHRPSAGKASPQNTDPTTYSCDNTTGLLEQVRFEVGSHDDSVFYSYGAMGQMTEVDDWIAAASGAADPLAFVYDDAGRLIAFEDYEALDEDGVAYEYDAAGRIAKMTDNYGEETTYAYDDAGRLTQITVPGAKTWTFSYNAAGQRTQITAPGPRTVESIPKG